jgi:hypothetical protein
LIKYYKVAILSQMKNTLLKEAYELIRSLTKSEKRYFKLYTRFQQGDKSYLKLFDIMDRQKIYNEKNITQKFLKHHRATNLPAIKKYLFDQLIGALKSYGAYKDLDSDHTDMIETYKVLHYKGLYGQSAKLLKKIKDTTLADDAFIRHYYVLLMEYLSALYDPSDGSAQKLKQIVGERKEVLGIIQNYSWVADVFIEQRLHLRNKLYCRNKKDKEDLTKIVMPLLQTTETEMSSRTALSMRNMALCDYYTAVGQPGKAIETSRRYLELRKNAGSLDKTDWITASEYVQYLWLSVRSGIFHDFEEYLRNYKLFSDKIRHKEKHAIWYERRLIYELIYLVRTAQFDKASVLLEEEKEKLAEYDLIITQKTKVMLWYFTAYLHFARQEHRPALKLIQRIMNEAPEDLEEYSFAKLLLMFIHYDLENYELLEYQVRSTQRLMEKKDRLYQCEKLMLDFFKNAGKLPGKREKQLQLAGLEKKVNTLFKTHYEKGFAFYFDIQSWLRSRLENKPFASTAATINQ